MYKRYLIGEINKGKNLEDETLLDPNRNPITETEFNRSGLRYKREISRYNAGRAERGIARYNVNGDMDDNGDEDEDENTMNASQVHTRIVFEGTSRGLDYDRVDTIAYAAAARVETGEDPEHVIHATIDELDELAASGRGNKRKTRSHQNKKTRKTRKIKRKSRK